LNFSPFVIGKYEQVISAWIYYHKYDLLIINLIMHTRFKIWLFQSYVPRSWRLLQSLNFPLEQALTSRHRFDLFLVCSTCKSKRK
jgi:hypothetical protein